MARTAKDVMQTHLITVDPSSPLVDVQRLFVEEEINGAPVVDDTGRLLGVVSSVDILRGVEEEHEAGATNPVYFRDLLEFSGPDWTRMPEDFQDRLSELTAADVMTESVVSVPSDAPIPRIAGILREHRIHRVMVVDGDALVGIITTLDLVGLLESPSE